MSIWRQVVWGLRGLLRRTAQNQEISDEVGQYFDEAAADFEARGLTQEEARRAARIECGNPVAVAEQMPSSGWENGVRTLLFDLRFAARQLRKNPGFSIVSAITLALGIGASTAIFSAVNPILFEPLPYPHANRILMIWGTFQGGRFEVAYGTYRELQERSRSFETMAIFEPWEPALTGGTEPERLDGQSVSADFFHVLGVSPALGRDFRASEEGLNAPKVVILSNRLWQNRFHGDPSILGSQVKLDGDNYTVIGVMPRGFEDVLSPSTEL